MTQFQSNVKNARAQGNRTLFDCQQFRVTVDNDEPPENSVTRKRPIASESTSVIPKK